MPNDLRMNEMRRNDVAATSNAGIIIIYRPCMRNIFAAILLTSLSHFQTTAQQPKIISDCVVYFSMNVEDSKANPQVIKSLAGATQVLYIKGSKSRVDLITPGFKQTTLADSKSDSTIILRELGNTKYISYLNRSKRVEQNKRYEGVQFNKTNEKKTILGYECRKLVATLSDGSAYNVFYTSSITPSNKEYEYQFKNLAGFVLEYESESVDGKTKVKFSADKITLEPVATGLFDLPKSGYRIL